MSLILRISVNDTPLETIAARRVTGTDDPDSRNTYAVKRWKVIDGRWAIVGEPATVQHRYGDGALVLADLALEAVR